MTRKMHCPEGLHPPLLKSNHSLNAKHAFKWQLMAGLGIMTSKTSHNNFSFSSNSSFKFFHSHVSYHIHMLSMLVFVYYLYNVFFPLSLSVGPKKLWGHCCRQWEFHKVLGLWNAVLKILLEEKGIINHMGLESMSIYSNTGIKQ